MNYNELKAAYEEKEAVLNERRNSKETVKSEYLESLVNVNYSDGFTYQLKEAYKEARKNGYKILSLYSLPHYEISAQEVADEFNKTGLNEIGIETLGSDGAEILNELEEYGWKLDGTYTELLDDGSYELQEVFGFKLTHVEFK